jgi:hypothetical protein
MKPMLIMRSLIACERIRQLEEMMVHAKLKNNLCLTKLCVLLCAALATCCAAPSNNRSFSPSVSASLPPSLSPTQNNQANVGIPQAQPTQSNSAIRSVDFAHLTYPNFPDYTNPGGQKRRSITLKPGKAMPDYANFGDVTMDGIEDAMVVLGVENRGSAIPYYVYIFTIENDHPKLIWDFETGDRADGGLRQIYAEDGELVIELYGKDRVVGHNLYLGDEALCCPKEFTRTRYKWNGKQFVPDGESKILENPQGHGSPIMPDYVKTVGANK